MTELLNVKNIGCSVEDGTGKGKKVILKNISFSLEKGKILGISGESGSGKTTLSKILCGTLTPSEGNIIFNYSAEWKKISASPVQILFQNNGEVLNPFREIDDIVKEALRIRNGKSGDIDNIAEKIFESVSFPERLRKRKGYELSGGEQQRAALARLLAVKPELLILDEPFSAQDTESQLNLLNLFKKINSEFGITLICVAHNLKILRKLCDEVIIMYKGEIVEKGKTDKIFGNPEHPYTQFLLKAENYDLNREELKFDIS